MIIDSKKLIEALTTDERLGDLTLRDLGKVIKIINEQEPVDVMKENRCHAKMEDTIAHYLGVNDVD